MTTSPEGSVRPPRGQIARLFAGALEGEERPERVLHLLAFGLAKGQDTAAEAHRALVALGGPRPDGACPQELRGTERQAWATSYADQLRAEIGRCATPGS